MARTNSVSHKVERKSVELIVNSILKKMNNQNMLKI